MNQPNFYNEHGELATAGSPRVSTILDVRAKPEVVAWMLRVGPDEAARIKEEATSRGTTVHEACETYSKTGDIVALPEDYELYLQGFINWCEKFKPSHIYTEIPIRSKKHGYAGRTDLVCKLDGEWWLIDIKTSKRMDPGMGLQLAAYRQAYCEMFDVWPRTAILQLVPSLKRGYRFKEFEGGFDVFLAHKAIYDWEQSHKKPVVEPAWDGATLQLAGAL